MAMPPSPGVLDTGQIGAVAVGDARSGVCGRIVGWGEARAGMQTGHGGFGPQRQRLGACRGHEAERVQPGRVPADQHAGAQVDHPFGPGRFGGARRLGVGGGERQLVPLGPGQQLRC